jgi:FtsP/CotA-like multicopper oxidase with cupredoxin domain
MTRVAANPTRRGFIAGAGALGLATRLTPAIAQEPAPDHKIRIEPVSLELAPGHVIRTTSYNGAVPGPVLRLRQGKPVAIDVTNDGGYDNLVHWHGLHIPSYYDGAVEEGSALIGHGKSFRYRFTPEPAGTRWYHSHAMAMMNLSQGTYSGEFGFMIVDPAAGDPGRYDQEFLLAAHHWSGEWVSLQDMRRGPPRDNGLEIMYQAATLGDRMLGHGEPLRVKRGQRVLFRLLNASASMNISLAFSGHSFEVIALDGNPVPTPRTVDVLPLAAAERADVIVTMNNPGVWIFGSTDEDDRQMGMGVVVEYENEKGEPVWKAPPRSAWAYSIFARSAAAPDPDETFRLTFEKIAGGRGGMNRWTINGKSWPGTDPLFTVEQGKRYRLVMENRSGDSHPVHLHRHTFEVTKVGDRAMSGLMKDTLNMPRMSTAEIDFVADHPGPTLFHCHHQDHMDEGFSGLIRYA